MKEKRKGKEKEKEKQEGKYSRMGFSVGIILVFFWCRLSK